MESKVRVPNNSVPGIWGIVTIVQGLGKYMTILGTWTLRVHSWSYFGITHWEERKNRSCKKTFLRS